MRRLALLAIVLLLLPVRAASQEAAPVEEAPAGAPPESDRRALIDAEVRAPEDPTGFARAELVTVQTVHGIGIGAEVCLIAECSDTRAWVGALMLGAGAGFGLSFGLTGDGIRSGQAHSVNAGTLWGALSGVFAAIAFEIEATPGVAGTILGFQVTGTAVGAVIAKMSRPPVGDVALLDLVTIWTVGLTALGFGAAEFDGDPQVVGWSLLGATAVGLGVGSQMHRWTPMGRGRAMIITAGGLVGGLLGLGTAVLIGGDDVDSGPLLGSTMAGSIVGLGFTWWLTRDFDLPDTNAEISFAPAPGGGLTAVVRGTF